jgi:hypothetical protein
MKASRCFQVGSSLSVRPSANFRKVIVVLSVYCLAVILAPLSRAQKQAKIEVVSPTATAKQELVSTGGTVKIVYKVNDGDIDSIRFKIDAPPYDAASGSADFKKEGSHTFTAKLFKGKNTIHLFGFNGSDAVKTAAADVVVFCNNECAGSTSPKEPGSSNEGGTGETKPDSNITLKSPSGDVTAEGPVSSLIFVTGGIKTLSISVFDSDGIRVDYQPSVAVTDAGAKLGIAAPRLKMNKGQNFVRIFDPAKPEEKANETLAAVTCSGCAKIDAAVAAEAPKPEQKGRVKITSAKSITYGDKKEVKIKVKFDKVAGEAASDKQIIVEVVNNKKTTKSDPQTIAAADLGTDKEFPVKLGSGLNKVTVYDTTDRDNQRDYAEITCDGKCGNDADTKDIAIVQPKPPAGQQFLGPLNDSSMQAYVTVAKGSAIRQLQYQVMNGAETLTPLKVPISVDPSQNEVTVPITLQFIKGTNTIRVFDAEHGGSNNDASIVIKCDGEKCVTDLNVSTIVTNSQNTRIIVGLEQAGASSAKSQTKPFLDFFFTTPLLFDRPKGLVATKVFDKDGKPVLDDKGMPVVAWVRNSTADGAPRVPRAGLWGNVRLASTPEQLTTTGILPTNLVNLVGSSGATTNLVQSFDFLAGLEGRLFTANGSFLSLIPGIRQKTRFYVAGGFGAISPLDATQENPKFFGIPLPNSSQRKLFEQRYGIPPAGATQIALVPLERDRFFRQWYLGIRLKTFYCDRDTEGDTDCHRFRNSFPAIVDFMIGQNQSVTGGSFKRTSIDAAGNAKTRQAFVFRVDAFYPLPFREASFIYFYGTAMMKMGGNQKIDNFLVLDPATSSPSINDPTVYVPSVDFLRGLQSNRDYYRIGVGINLTDFFNRNKPKP